MSVNKKIPMRQCIGCMEMKSKKELIRVVKTPENEFIIDTTGKKNGRGAYICPKSECIQKAAVHKSLNRSFQMMIAEDVYDTLREELKRLEENS